MLTTEKNIAAGTLNLGDSVFLYNGNHCYMAIHWSLTPLFEVDYRSSWNKGIEQAYYTRFSHYRVAPGDRIRRPEQPN